MSTPLSLAYSPCPNDTYIFAAWTQGLLEGAPPVTVTLDDVEALNQAARAGSYMLTKVSYGAIPQLLSQYRILRSGGALGRGCGPLVLTSDRRWSALSELPSQATIAIPGEATTAFLLLQLAMGRRPNIRVMRFDAIMPAVAAGEVDAGLIIHESRFTYHEYALQAIADLGAWWEEQTGTPIPLGAILLRRDIAAERGQEIHHLIQASLLFAQAHPDRVQPYIREHAFEMSDQVMQAHIDLYVNEFSRDIGDEGEAAIRELFSRAARMNLIPPTVNVEFV